MNFPEDANYEQLHTSLFQLLDHHNVLTACTRLVTDRTLSAVFAPYVAEAHQNAKQ